VKLIGNLGADPELSYTPNGTAKATMRLATHEVWTNKDGTKGERTEWHRIIAWGRLAEVMGEYAAKGRQLFVSGRLQTRSWEDENNTKRWTTEIVASNIQLLGSPKAKKDAEPEEVEAPDIEGPDGDVPF
jgi:single-strand DNA-binding protein